MFRWIVIAIILCVIALAAYVRLAPIDIAAIHVPSYPTDVGDRDQPGKFHATRQFTTSQQDILKAVDTVISRTLRTNLIAGSIEDGMMTYETRSRIFGFPDYATVWVDDAGATLNIRSQLRFGIDDLGVNKARVISWLEQLGPLIVAP